MARKKRDRTRKSSPKKRTVPPEDRLTLLHHLLQLRSGKANRALEELTGASNREEARLAAKRELANAAKRSARMKVLLGLNDPAADEKLMAMTGGPTRRLARALAQSEISRYQDIPRTEKVSKGKPPSIWAGRTDRIRSTTSTPMQD